MNLGLTEFIVTGSALGVLWLLHALIVAGETSLIKFRYKLLEDKSSADTRLSGSTDYLFARGAQVASVFRFLLLLSHFGAAICVLFLTSSLWGTWGDVSFATMAARVFLVLGAAFIWFVIAEILPRGLALNRPQAVLAKTGWLLIALVQLGSPLIALFNGVGRFVFKLLGTSYPDDFNLLDLEVQLRALGEEDSNLSPVVHMILRNGLRMQELELSDVMLPRNQVQIIDTNDSLEESLERVKSAGHTRYPLCEDDLDKCLGIVHIKDIFRYQGDLAQLDLKKIRRKIIKLSNEAPLEKVLSMLLGQKIHMALVVDEFGGTVGVVTLENVLEQLVGQIRDEFDGREEDHVQSLQQGAFQVDGLTPIHDLEEKLEVEVQNEEVSTFGGLITAELGRFPKAGEELVLPDPGIAVKIDKMDERRIISATVRLLPQSVEAKE